MTARVLVVDDDSAVRYTLTEILEAAGYEVAAAADGEEALAAIDRSEFQLVITDLRMPRLGGAELLRKLRARARAPVVIVVTAHGSERHAVEAMKQGAFDYFRKPFEVEELLAVVRRAVDAAELQRDNERLQSELNLSRSLVFESAAMSRLAVLISRVAPRDVTVLITGESGTGKERVAEALVRASRRAKLPFVRFNCAAVTEELAEAELFGHAKGAFTGALRARGGVFGEADGGTLLLDEIAELQPSLQAKLLRALQDGEVRPVGEDRSRRVDVRIVAATHRDLQERVARGYFRRNLLSRLNVVHLHIPPLRERPEDIEVLARHFLARFATRFGVGPFENAEAVLARLTEYGWPGNVRELENTVERLVALSDGERLDVELLPARAVGEAESGGGAALTLKQRVDAYERGLVMEALRATRQNRSEAARRLGVSRVTLHDKLRRYALVRGEDGEGEEPGGAE